MEDGRTVGFLFLPDGEDPDSIVQKEGKQAFLQRVKKSLSLTDFLIKHLAEQADLDRLDGRAKLASLSKPLIKQLPKGILRQLVIENIGRLVKTNPQSLLDPEPPAPSKNFTRRAKSSQAKPVPLTPVRRAISMLLQHPSLANDVIDAHSIARANVRGADVLGELIELCQNSPNMSTATVLERYREQSVYPALEKLAIHDHLLPTDALQSTFQNLLRQIDASAQQSELDSLLLKAENESLSSDEKRRLNALLQRWN